MLSMGPGSGIREGVGVPGPPRSGLAVGVDMPLIEVNVIKDVFSPEQKREIISRLTDAMVEIEG
jgi:molybdopterin-guanine dinucleotide biosynthesis protein A